MAKSGYETQLNAKMVSHVASTHVRLDEGSFHNTRIYATVEYLLGVLTLSQKAPLTIALCHDASAVAGRTENQVPI